MKKDTAAKLQNALDTYDKRQAEIKKQQERVKSEHEVFLEAFEKKITEVIRPTMEELGAEIKKRGHNIVITKDKETQDEKGKTTAAQVRMEIHPKGQRPPSGSIPHCPALAFIAGTSDNKVWSHVSTMMPERGGSAGKRNDYELQGLIHDVIEEEIVHLLSECFGK